MPFCDFHFDRAWEFISAVVWLERSERIELDIAFERKIGRSINPEQRVRTLSGTKAPEGIEIHAGTLLGTIPGGARTESALHLRFRPHRLVGEWFDYAQVADAIATLLAERSEVAA
ncbi:GIY-YIG nuclease family protein [Nocardioides marmoriginsengisoli]|uniref:GIY-YIG nuclease family protein n=1 Tax=Nocardioides marmoriginsengisoli TaxID=661483 RepID=UPI001612A6C2|nr:GIY-YIG nuclease family protein [Nocardioides marmoriginsengisoli]